MKKIELKIMSKILSCILAIILSLMVVTSCSDNNVNRNGSGKLIVSVSGESFGRNNSNSTRNTSELLYQEIIDLGNGYQVNISVQDDVKTRTGTEYEDIKAGTYSILVYKKNTSGIYVYNETRTCVLPDGTITPDTRFADGDYKFVMVNEAASTLVSEDKETITISRGLDSRPRVSKVITKQGHKEYDDLILAFNMKHLESAMALKIFYTNSESSVENMVTATLKVNGAQPSTQTRDLLADDISVDESITASSTSTENLTFNWSSRTFSESISNDLYTIPNMVGNNLSISFGGTIGGLDMSTAREVSLSGLPTALLRNTRYTIILTVSEIIADNPIIDPDKAYFIYFENNGSLGCDTWANIKSKNKVSDIAFFKFGSVVGFTRPSLTFSVIFNPTSYSYSTWTSVPNSDKNGITHTVSNGLGDPCKLVSIPLASIKSGTKIDNGIWRIPTNNENNSFISKKTPSSFGISDMILGYRDYNNDGAASDVNDFGYWWSSTTHSATDGYCVQFTTSKLETKAGGKYRYNNGYIVRCVAK